MAPSGAGRAILGMIMGLRGRVMALNSHPPKLASNRQVNKAKLSRRIETTQRIKTLYPLRCFYPLGKFALFVKNFDSKISKISQGMLKSSSGGVKLRAFEKLKRSESGSACRFLQSLRAAFAPILAWIFVFFIKVNLDLAPAAFFPAHFLFFLIIPAPPVGGHFQNRGCCPRFTLPGLEYLG